MAPWLLGKLLVRRGEDGEVRAAGRIVEVEAYGGLDDPASHAARGPTPRARTMFDVPGTLYVYRSYGVHWCANVVCHPPGTAGAVLVRAVEPVVGAAWMAAGRPRGRPQDLCRGPGRLCQALRISGDLDGTDLLDRGAPVQLVGDGHGPLEPVAVSPRVGISRAVDRPWRWWHLTSPWVSKPPRSAR